MSAQRRRQKALDRQAEVHRRGICGGPGKCRLWHGSVAVGQVANPAAPTVEELASFRDVGRLVEQVSYRGRGA